MKSMKPLILLTNDDGFFAEGIESLFRSLKGLGNVYIIAPDREKSATSLALTLHRPLRVKRIKSKVYAVDGTPADCVYLALQKLLPRKPVLLISGINRGPNLGQQDISPTWASRIFPIQERWPPRSKEAFSGYLLWLSPSCPTRNITTPLISQPGL